ncbi:hypothetical protein K504DRAFT_407036 [Pleomassaria siparia CBS 279.74]|uniref:G protein-coupled receptor GPR1/2/3 C-terminal domain-containing protein n=1 Tax=Pleomassaria siparia CBS 279.74 TaxID=1314801 RepID=A0A6G1K9Z9_9PLEO|nr:hypothetical protein K504DRAFT_407036 [Pleomassaria siparia CBS 279.74]
MAPMELEIMAALEGRTTFEKRNFPFPNSLDPLTPTFRKGLIPIAFFAMLSLLSVTALLIFITHRLVSWRKHYKEYVGYNQYVILIYNLLLADLQQSIAFAISFHWIQIDKILAPTVPCFMQAWFLNLGDVSSGFFVLAIAIHTWMGVVKGYKLPYLWFVVSILGIWFFALFLTILGPAMHGDRFFARAGGWCWIAVDFEKERLYLHYMWIFIVEFGTIAIYGHVFVHLRGRIRIILNNDTSKLSRATKFMVMYPAVYIVLTLPLALGRMVSMAGSELPDLSLCVSGALLTSCGWVDALLYTLTRRILVTNDVSECHAYSHNVTAVRSNAMRPGDDSEDFDLQSINKEVGTARTVTIVGGSNRISRLVETSRGRDKPRGRNTAQVRVQSNPMGDHSPTGSQDSIIKPGMGNIGIVTETNIEVESTDKDSDISPSRSHGRNISESDLNRPSI